MDPQPVWGSLPEIIHGIPPPAGKATIYQSLLRTPGSVLGKLNIYESLAQDSNILQPKDSIYELLPLFTLSGELLGRQNQRFTT